MTYNTDFLYELDRQKNRIIHIRITRLTLEEYPVEAIEGVSTGGNINVEGNSAVRRTCSLSLITNQTNFADYLWTLNSKFMLEIGLENHVDKTQPDIIWFKQGKFLISTFSTSYTTNSCSISIQGKDKMALLNGEIGGNVNSSVDFGTFEEVMNNNTPEDKSDDYTKIIPLPVKQIIRDMVHQYAGEPFHNIIINDLDETGLQMMEYVYNEALYLFRQDGDSEYYQGTTDGELEVYIINEETNKKEKIAIKELKQFDSLNNLGIEATTESIPIWFTADETTSKRVLRVKNGEVAGYKETDLTYPGDLIANPGETISSVLDKIKNFLGDFEYFYDLDGRFVFQRKKAWINTNWSPISDGTYVKPLAIQTPYSYIFKDSELFSSFNNSPQINNVRNDFTVWGEKSSGAAIHMRYAIDKKPTEYNSIEVSDEDLSEYNKQYGLKVSGQKSQKYLANKKTDWRELIYQMARDYRKYNHLDDFEQRVAAANSNLYPTGKTGYEQYYIDMEGFWRWLYDPTAPTVDENGEEVPAANGEVYWTSDGSPWNKKVEDAPDELIFWIDFLDSNNELEKFSIPAIGDRTKVENDNAAKAIYYRDIPSIIFYNKETKPSDDKKKTGYRYFGAGRNFDMMFKISTQGKSAKEALDTLLYNHTYCTESVSITSVPIYYLEPNTRIYINDLDSGIEGDYIITSFSIPLNYSGQMTITATKAHDRLL